MGRKKASAKASPFGEASRVEILNEHFRAFGAITVATAWKFVYEELLWFDRSTGLLHLYESDKAQPGRSSWYQRSVTFTNRVAELYAVDRDGLKARIDRLFLACVQRLIERDEAAAEQAAAIAAVGKEIGLPTGVVAEAEEKAEVADAEADFVPYAEFVGELVEMLMIEAHMSQSTAAVLSPKIVERAQYHLTFGSNRQNCLGEGFEDLLKLLAVQVAGVPESQIIVRKKADKLPGFGSTPDKGRRIEKPDLSFVEDGRTRLISTVKWSLRHDRQKQLTDELDCYAQLLSQNGFPEYVLVTNEYDPGRLKNTSNLSSRGQKLECIYHINPELLVEVLSDVQSSVNEVKELINEGRLKSLADFLSDLATKYKPVAPAKPRRKK